MVQLQNEDDAQGVGASLLPLEGPDLELGVGARQAGAGLAG